MSLPFEPRDEDRRLLTGAGRFCDDEREAGEAHAVFVRSPHAFAAIRGIDASAARALPGVLAVLTAADMEAGRHRQCDARQPGPERRRAGRAGSSGAGRRLRPPCRRGRRAGRRRERGDRARRRRACRGRLRAARPGHRCRGRGAFAGAATLARGAGQYRARLARVRRHRARARSRRSSPTAAHVARVRLVNQRIVMAPMEPRGALARYDGESGRFILSCASQSAFVLRQNLAQCMGIAAGAHPRPERRCRRRVRHARDRLSGISGAARRGAADRPRRALAGEPLRGVSDRQPGARHDHRGGAGARTPTGGFSRSISTCSPIWAPI